MDGPAGTIYWRWCAFDSLGNRVLQAEKPFEMLSECVEDAKQNGYVEPESRK